MWGQGFVGKMSVRPCGPRVREMFLERRKGLGLRGTKKGGKTDMASKLTTSSSVPQSC